MFDRVIFTSDVATYKRNWLLKVATSEVYLES